MSKKALASTDAPLEKATLEHLNKLKKRLAKEGASNLNELDYKKYLKSSLWKSIKLWILNRDDNKCTVCGRRNHKISPLEVHHRSYDLEVLEGKRSAALTTLCGRCHELVEFHANGRKRTCLEEKDIELKRIKTLHKEIEKTNLPLLLKIYRKRTKHLIEVEYTGNPEFLDFYSIKDLIMGFLVDTYIKNRELIEIPLPFPSKKLTQKSGAKTRCKITQKELINTKVLGEKALIHVHNDCPLDIPNLLSDYCENTHYWRVTETIETNP